MAARTVAAARARRRDHAAPRAGPVAHPARPAASDIMNGMWTVSSADGTRHVKYEHDGAWTADPDTIDAMHEGAGQPVPLAPMGELYTPSSPTDPVGVYLLACKILPGPIRVTGEPPAVPEPNGVPAGTGINY